VKEWLADYELIVVGGKITEGDEKATNNLINIQVDLIGA
jgi:hypothetical protein